MTLRAGQRSIPTLLGALTAALAGAGRPGPRLLSCSGGKPPRNARRHRAGLRPRSPTGTGLTSPATRPAASAADNSLVVAHHGVVLAGLAIRARARLLVVPLPLSLAVLVDSAPPLVGPVRQLGALPAGGRIAIGLMARTSRLSCGGLAARRRRGQRRGPGRSRRSNRRAGLGALHSQAEDNPDQGAEDCANGDQELAATAKRSVHRGLQARAHLTRLPEPICPKSRTLNRVLTTVFSKLQVKGRGGPVPLLAYQHGL